jgi:hypothetical protein
LTLDRSLNIKKRFHLFIYLFFVAGAFLLRLLRRLEPERKEESFVRRITAAVLPECLSHRQRAAQRQERAPEPENVNFNSISSQKVNVVITFFSEFSSN